MNDLAVVLDNVWLRVGTRQRQVTYNVGTHLVPNPRMKVASFALILQWTNQHSFLQISASHKRPGAVAPEPFLVGEQGVCRVLGEINRIGKLRRNELDTNYFIAAKVGLGVEVTLRVSVDTDHPQFRDLLDKLAGNAAEIDVIMLAVDQVETDSGKLVLRLEPARVPPPYRGYVAIDLGNTATSVACLREGLTDLSDIQLLNADGLRGVLSEPDRGVPGTPLRAVPSAVRIDEIDTRPDEVQFQHHHPDWASWVVGSAATSAPGGDGLVLGAKRLASTRDGEKRINVAVRDTRNSREGPRVPVQIARRIPAELVVCRVLQRFREATYAQPHELALTYPSTLSKRELDNLSEAIYRGWLRMQVIPQTPSEMERQTERLPLQLDEAAAAGFYFLFRKIFQGPAGMPGFRYQYPRGLNLLLYDCGGGTTDVALVTARGDDVNRKRVVVKVLARTGLREFGGDNITTEVFRLLKAKIAITLVHQLHSAPPGVNLPTKLTEQVADLGRELQQYAGPINLVVPTRFEPDEMDVEANRNRQHTLDLWNLAEDVKRLLETKKEANPAINTQLALFEYLRLQGRANLQAAQLGNHLGQIKITRREVDALIREPLERSIDSCNGLIEEKLTKAGEEVHCVAAAGNAIRYPLIREMLEQKLDIHHYPSRFEWDPDNLKFAVSKGAVLALQVIKTNTGLIDFPRDLCHRLPFDVAFHDLENNRFHILFREHQLYDELRPQDVRIEPAQGATEGVKTIILYRHWPGEKDRDRHPLFTPFLTYRFDEPVRGPVRVSYDRDRMPPEFVVKYGDIEGRLEEEHEQNYRSPLQRGTL